MANVNLNYKRDMDNRLKNNYLTDDEMKYSIEDQLYILSRNKLIPEAEVITNRFCQNSKGFRTKNWSQFFLMTMDALARQHGLVR